jgi:anti-sigma B factor antagonist
MRDGALAIEIRGAVVHARFRGDIDLSNVDELHGEITAATPNDALGIVFDLSAVQYLDSAGLRLIQRLREDLRARGQRLQLVIPDDSIILDVLRLAGLDWREEIVQSADAGRGTLEPDAG